MSALFSIGQRVALLDSAEGGVVRQVEADRVLIEDEFGFEAWHPLTAIVPTQSDIEAYEAPLKSESEVMEPEVMRPFAIGERVHELNGANTGTVVRYLNEHIVLVRDVHGFDHKMEVTHLVARDELDRAMSASLATITAEDIGEEPPKETGERSLKDRRNMGVWEIDLHIQELVDNSYGWSNAQIIEKQLEHFVSKLDLAIYRGTKKVIFIHGRGKGVLRDAMREVLDRYPNCDALDADYKRYGVGATEVRILYKA